MTSDAPVLQHPSIPFDHIRLRIDLFCEDKSTAETAVAALSGRPFASAEVSKRMGGIQAARETYAQARSPDLIIVESLLDAEELCNGLEALAEVCDEDVKVIVIGRINDVALYRELLQRHISDYLVTPVDPHLLAESAALVLKGGAADKPGRVIAFIGAKGGCGSSTICHNAAWVMAESLTTETVIADFDLAFGTLGLDFNQDSGQGLSEALAATHKLDLAMMGKLLSRCTDKLGLLTASYMLDAETAIEPDAAVRVAELLSQSAPFVFLDLPLVWQDWSRALIESADDVVITAEPDLPNLRNAKNLIDTARALRTGRKPPILIINKIGMPRRPEISLKDFANALDQEPATSFTFDAQLFGTAANNGLMIGEMAPKSRYLGEFMTLAGQLGGEPPSRNAPAGFMKPLIDRLSRKLAV
jgi:pilus assembly protein CpaE